MLVKKTFFDKVEEINEETDIKALLDGLCYGADQIRETALLSEDVNVKNCALNNLFSISEAIKFIATVNEFVLTEKQNVVK
ncbi:hypothetical protein ACVWYG_000714 [Pedobacter sp. UYEF25]